ncbi:MAG TPA: 2-phospho-L-lactate guanylyltransferase [Actinomycetota bacterium]
MKALDDAKSRLAPSLGPIERRLLTIAMLEDVVAALQATGGLEPPAVISPDREIWRRADAMGCRVIEEEPGAADLNRSLARAAGMLGGDHQQAAVALPLASPAALVRVLAAAAAAPVVVVPSRDASGTNVLAWRDRASFQPGFGPGSAARHLAVPGALRHDEPDLALDVDTVADLRAVAERVDPASVTGRRLRDLRLPDRLQQVP